MKLHYYLFDPTGNITALIISPAEKHLRQGAAKRVMENEPTCEQAGFVYMNEKNEPCLDMAGGEFCANASMSAAALRRVKDSEDKAAEKTVTLNVSGQTAPVAVAVQRKSENDFVCEIRLSPPKGITEKRFCFNNTEFIFPTVEFDGITHVIAPKGILKKNEAGKAVKLWCEELGAPALGIMFFDEKEKTMTPLVYVPEADTLFWESSCASGSCAVGAYLSKMTSGKIEVSLSQPGGALTVEAENGGEIVLSGNVKLLKEVTADI